VRSDLGHLPARQQRELERVRDRLLSGFEAALARGGGATSDWRRSGRVLKLLLFGSYARNDWVDAPDTGYQSDFDILAIVSHPALADVADYWWEAEDAILRDPEVGRTVNVIVHTMAEVNAALLKSEPFWTDIIADGIALHEAPGHPFVTPAPLSPEQAAETAERHFAEWLPRVDSAIDLAGYALSKAQLRDAAFLLHQVTERLYICFLLVHTAYYPRSHNVRFLRSLAEDVEKRLVAAWPRDTRADRRRFELLKRAYVEARYSDQYEIGPEDLSALEGTCRSLRDTVESLCRARVRQLRAALGDMSL
jgi:predicted nucleotidyltransferase/HEPN domain-containing protein